MRIFIHGVKRPMVLGVTLFSAIASPAFSQPDPALGRAQVIPAAVAGCEALSISFRTPLQFVDQSLNADQRTLTVRLTRGTTQRAENIAADLIETVPPIPLAGRGTVGVTLDNSQTDPVLVLRFPTAVQPLVQQTGNRSIVISGIGNLSPEFCGALSGSENETASVLPDIGTSDDAEIDAVFAQARTAITEENYTQATQLLTKLIGLGEHSRSAEAQELLGVVRERNGQLAHAKAEYEIYLEKYPDGEGAVRVRQRLAGVLTAQAARPDALREADGNVVTAVDETGTTQTDVRPTGGGRNFGPRPQPQEQLEPEDPAVTGLVTSYYFSNQGSTTINEFTTNSTTTDDQVFQNALVTTLDINGHKDLDGYSLDWRFQGDLENDFTTGGSNTVGLSRLYAELTFGDGEYATKLGRQKLNSSGVFGRFDGALISWDQSERFTYKAVLGAPVSSVKDAPFASAKLLFGASVDITELAPNLDSTFYYVQQNDGSFTDRQAIGIEASYLTDDKSIYGLVDYDLFFNRINTARISGTLILANQSSFSATADFVHSPTLTLGNALQGQSATTLAQLSGTYTLSEMRQLALDRTVDSKSVTLAYSRPLTDNWQLSVDTTLFDTSGSPASGGVAATAAPGLEFYASTQLVGTSIFREGDIVSASARIAETSTSSLFLLDGYTRFSYNERLRLKPRLKIGFRDLKSSTSMEQFFIPSLTADYEINDSSSLEFELGGRISNLDAPSFSEEQNEAFATIGFTYEF